LIVQTERANEEGIKVLFDDLQPTVVIADDHPRMLEMVAGVLRPSFTILAQAEDGDTAFKAITELCPQLAVLDLSMPRMHGIEVARQLSATQSLTKVVFLTLHTGEEFLSEARRYGHGYVLKSRLYSDLLAALYAALQGEFFASDLAQPRP
jgi:DNA-binding NarL/FixJ family response regulator